MTTSTVDRWHANKADCWL